MIEEELGYLLIKQKDSILKLINNRKYKEAQAAINILHPLWENAGYEYKTRELTTLLEERRKSARS